MLLFLFWLTSLHLPALAEGENMLWCSIAGELSGDCPAPWTALTSSGGTGCYLFLTEALTWSQAKERCDEESAYLAEIADREEHRFLGEQVRQRKTKNAGFWIGLKADERTWDHVCQQDFSKIFTFVEEEKMLNKDISIPIFDFVLEVIRCGCISVVQSSPSVS